MIVWSVLCPNCLDCLVLSELVSTWVFQACKSGIKITKPSVFMSCYIWFKPGALDHYIYNFTMTVYNCKLFKTLTPIDVWPALAYLSVMELPIFAAICTHCLAMYQGCLPSIKQDSWSWSWEIGKKTECRFHFYLLHYQIIFLYVAKNIFLNMQCYIYRISNILFIICFYILIVCSDEALSF